MDFILVYVNIVLSIEDLRFRLIQIIIYFGYSNRVVRIYGPSEQTRVFQNEKKKFFYT